VTPRELVQLLAVLTFSACGLFACERATAGESKAERSTSMQLQQVKLVELARLVFSELLGEGYIFDASFLDEKSEVTIDVKAIDPEDARRLVVDTAKQQGFVVEKVGKVWRFGRPRAVAAPELEVFFYRPKYRSVQYLADLLGSLFPGGSFSFQRGGTPATGPGVFPAAGGIPPIVGGIVGAPGSNPPGAGRPALSGAASAAGGGPYLPGVGQSSGTGGGGTQVDARVDAFIYRGTEKDIERLRKLLAQVDVASGELVVRAVVYEVRKGSNESSALSIAADLLNGKLGISFGAAGGANSVSIAVGGFKAVVSAFASDARFKAVSAPSVRVQSGQTARFTVGDETPVLGNTVITQGGTVSQGVEYRPSGVILELKPIVRDEMVDLDVKQQLSTFAVTTSGVNNSPTLLKREVHTVLGVKPGETIVIAGLEDSRSTADRTGLSFLPRWMDSKGKTDDRTEVLLVLDVQRVGG
jgi:general secretion pathway protein D